jgi:hypothetical protein
MLLHAVEMVCTNATDPIRRLSAASDEYHVAASQAAFD